MRQRQSPSGRPQLGAELVWTGGPVPANDAVRTLFAVPGARVGDVPYVVTNPTAIGLIATSERVVNADQVWISIANCTTNPLDPGALAMFVRVVR